MDDFKQRKAIEAERRKWMIAVLVAFILGGCWHKYHTPKNFDESSGDYDGMFSFDR